MSKTPDFEVPPLSQVDAYVPYVSSTRGKMVASFALDQTPAQFEACMELYRRIASCLPEDPDDD